MGELINGRTPEKVRFNIAECAYGQCLSECPYDSSDECTRFLMEDALVLIQRLEAQQPKWISAKERLPVKQYRVIVRTGHNLVTTGWRSYHVDVKGGELWEVDEAHNYRNDVTHWMPTPEPKKEDT